MGERSSRRGWFAPIIGAAAIVAFGLAALTHPTDPLLGTPTEERIHEHTMPPQTGTKTATQTQGALKMPKGGEVHQWATILQAILVGIIVIGIAIALWRLIMWLWSRRAQREHAVVLDPRTNLADTLAEQAEHLRRGGDDNSIVDCWIALQDTAAGLGVEPRDSETAADLATRVMLDLDVDAGALDELAQLYREARFSRHPLTEDNRRRAISCLERLRASLAVRGDVHA